MKIVALLGGNIGDTLAKFKQAINFLEEFNYTITGNSAFYRSEAWGYTSSNDYFNQVILFETNDLPNDILKNCLSIEKKIGRLRNENDSYSDRPIDIDLLYIDDQIIEEKDLHIPHPRLHLRRFTLLPLVEILPDFIHPILKIDHKSLLLLCSDSGKVEEVD